MTQPEASASDARSRFAFLTSIARTRKLQYGLLGFGIGLMLTWVGYLVDYHALYHDYPSTLSLAVIRGLHEVTPVHYFTDGFALILALVGAIAGALQDRLRYHSSHLEDLVGHRTESLRLSEERYALAARGSNDGLWDWDLEHNRIHYSARWLQTLGLSERTVGESPEDWLGRVHPEDRAGLEARIASHLAGTQGHLVAEYRMRHADGSYRWMMARGMAVRHPGAGRPHRLAGSQADVDERKRMEEQLIHLAVHDPLTSLPNRSLFLDRLTRAFQRAAKRGRRESLAVIFLDVDQFKNINDSLGHQTGDAVLVQVAERFRAVLQEVSDELRREIHETEEGFTRASAEWTVSRIGGDEFTVLLDDIRSLHDAMRVVRRLEDAVRTPLASNGRELQVTLSTGVVLGPAGYRRPEDLLRDADTAMYLAKSHGRGKCEIFDEKMMATAQEQFRLENDLQMAQAQGQFRVVFQPIVELGTEHLRGFEALLRWHHPERGLIPPQRFIPLAEETGIILPLGAWVLKEACRNLRAWQDSDPKWDGLFVTVNLSLRQIYHPGLEELISRAIQESSLDPSLLHLEITENQLIEHPKEVTSILTRLRRRGFRVAIDDFGTGYSSLSVLQSLPVDVLKMDKLFVAKMNASEKARKIVASIVGLGAALDHDVIAEGIENERQLRELRTLRCPLGQGNFFSEPISPEDVRKVILPSFKPSIMDRRERASGGGR
ncbi:MAG TPA: EAL domain-containing protein [Candidatus Polarisedimenticolia bacterium]|nr:EAL domain-containing protein [Candidatus Polarisedimenticolia bacterium]